MKDLVEVLIRRFLSVDALLNSVWGLLPGSWF